MKQNNQINVIFPYKLGNMWVYDDPDVPVYAEPFVMGSSELIDFFVEGAENCTVLFSEKPLPEYTAILDEEKDQEGFKGFYRLRGSTHVNWLCGHLLDYFLDYPKQIYILIK